MKPLLDRAGGAAAGAGAAGAGAGAAATAGLPLDGAEGCERAAASCWRRAWAACSWRRCSFWPTSRRPAGNSGSASVS